MSASACLVLGDPQYRDPEMTAPRVTPLTRPEELITALSEVDGSWEVSFRVAIESEDAGVPVELVLLRNFGGILENGRPYEGRVGGRVLAPGTLRDGKRAVTVRWFDAGVSGIDYDCARITLLATHAFRSQDGADFFCPADPDDADTVTWVVRRCRADDDNCSFDLCEQSTPTEPNYCDPPSEEEG
ncbi:MAG: hypothetical protein AAF602_28170 [Myxococcota bacterium]